MAAAIVPVVLGLLPQIIDLIAGLVHKKAPAVEQQFGAGTGPVKFATVFEYVISSLQQAAAAGQIDKTLPSDEAIKAVIQAVVASLNLQGLLAPDSVAVPQAQAITLASGQSITITVK